MGRRPRPPTANSRSMLKTLREPARLNYNKNHPSSAPNIAAPSSRTGGNHDKINFTISKPLKQENVFQGFEEDLNLIDFSDDDAKSKLIDDGANLEFDVQDYFDDYLDVDQEEMKRLEALNSLEGVQQKVQNLSMNSVPLSPREKSPSPHTTQSTSAILTEKTISKPPPKQNSLRPTPKTTESTPVISKPVTPKVAQPRTGLPKTSTPRTAASRAPTPKTAPKPTVQKQSQKSRVPDRTPRVRPAARAAQSTPALRSKTPVTTTKGPALVNRRVIRKTAPTAPRAPASNLNKVASKPQSASASKSEISNTTPPVKKASKPQTSPSVSSPAAVEEELSVDEEKALKEALEDDIIAQLRGVDPTAAKQIFSEIVVHGDEVHWDDIAGLESAKSSLKEAVVYPFLRPDLFRGLREPVRGMLLFGPPGTGKTMLARAVATESKSTFFSISASSLTSKYLGESEKLVRALFAIAKKLSPSIVFVDEIDSIMGSRNNDGENESSRRIKNEFLVQWSSLSNAAAGKKEDPNDEEDERVLVLAATNLPWSIDEAARRRFVRRQYIPLPEAETREKQLRNLLAHQTHTLTEEDFHELLALTDGYSGSDITSLAKDAAMGPLRELGDKLLFTPRDQIRPITLQDVKNSLSYIKPSVSKEGLIEYEDWAKKFGSSGV